MAGIYLEPQTTRSRREIYLIRRPVTEVDLRTGKMRLEREVVGCVYRNADENTWRIACDPHYRGVSRSAAVREVLVRKGLRQVLGRAPTR